MAQILPEREDPFDFGDSDRTEGSLPIQLKLRFYHACMLTAVTFEFETEYHRAHRHAVTQRRFCFFLQLTRPASLSSVVRTQNVKVTENVSCHRRVHCSFCSLRRPVFLLCPPAATNPSL